MALDIKGTVKPKSGFITYILRCGSCNSKTMRDMRRRQKTTKGNCPRCHETTRMRVVGKVKKFYKRWNTLKLQYWDKREITTK